MAVKNMAASVLTRLKNQAKNEGIPFQIVLQLFAQEEFLRRLSRSDYAENMILKGGMFLYTLMEFDSRPTRDIDFLVWNFQGSPDGIERMMKEICRVDTGNDFIALEVLGAERISANKKYPGVKTKFLGYISNVRIPFSIDVGVDDVIVPKPVKRVILTRLPEFESPKVLTYSLESTVAEKFDAILQRMAGTSRMKDFYDIYYLSGIFDFDGAVLSDAVRSTLRHRRRETPAEAFADIMEFGKDEFLLTQWKAFEPAQTVSLSFGEVVGRLGAFLEPIYNSILQNGNFSKKWSCEHKIWE